MPRAALAIALVVATAACTQPTPPPAGPAVPEGLALSGSATSLRALAQQLQTLQGTPVASFAATASEAVADCTRFAATLPPGAPASDLASSLRCGAGGEERDPTITVSYRSDAAGTVTATAAPDEAGGWSLSGALAGPEQPGAGAMLLPSDRGPGTPLLSGTGALVHLRGRSDGGLDLEAFVPEGSEADTMLGLRGGLLSGALLDGTWETVLYEVSAGSTVPPIVLAAGHRIRAAAEVALDGLASKFEAEHGTRRTDISVAGLAGLCLPALKVLPEFAPCGVVTDDAVVLGWNEAALRRALEGAAATPGALVPPTAEASWLAVDLAALPASDATLIAARRDAVGEAPEPIDPLVWPWAGALLTGRRDGVVHRFELRLTAAGATP